MATGWIALDRALWYHSAHGTNEEADRPEAWRSEGEANRAATIQQPGRQGDPWR